MASRFGGSLYPPTKGKQMTREEAFKLARIDWNKEETARKENEHYMFGSDVIKWIENIREAVALSSRICTQLTNIRDGLFVDQKILDHYCSEYSSDIRGNMATKDYAGARELVTLLTNFSDTLTNIIIRNNEGEQK